MNSHSEICVDDSGKITLPSGTLETLGAKTGDTFEIFTDVKEDKIYLFPKGRKLSELKEYTSVALGEEASVELPQPLMDEMDLCRNQELSIVVDLEQNCIVLAPIPPYCVFCGELGDITLNGKHICAECVDKIASLKS